MLIQGTALTLFPADTGDWCWLMWEAGVLSKWHNERGTAVTMCLYLEKYIFCPLSTARLPRQWSIIVSFFFCDLILQLKLKLTAGAKQWFLLCEVSQQLTTSGLKAGCWLGMTLLHVTLKVILPRALLKETSHQMFRGNVSQSKIIPLYQAKQVVQ